MAEATLLLKKCYSPCFIQIRTLIKNYVSPGGIKYHGFKYHPRHPEFKDEPYEPSKLFLIKRIKPVWGTNPIERRALQLLNIDGHIKIQGHIAVVKNIPEVNSLLWKIKHLVSIVPITCPQGLPENVGFGETYLHDNGRFEVRPLVKNAAERVEVTKKFIEDPKRLTVDLIKKHLRDKWMNPMEGTLNSQ